MILFLDTEWADNLGRDLVSIGLTSRDGQHQYYAEADPLPKDPLAFVEYTVYPLLERGAAAMSVPVMGESLRAFIFDVTKASGEAPTIAFDYHTDKAFFTCIYRADIGHETIPVEWLDLGENGDIARTYANHVELHWRADPAAASRRHHALIDATIAARAYGSALACLSGAPLPRYLGHTI